MTTTSVGGNLRVARETALLLLLVPVSVSAQFAQQGSKMVGTGIVGASLAHQGQAVAVSPDGNTAIVGGPTDNSGIGATWVFTRSGGVWSQQGNKLVGTGVTGTSAQQGSSVAISADGNTAIVGGYWDNGFIGATWVFTRNGSTWTQQGNKLVGTGNSGTSQQGYSVAISADGNTALVGGNGDNSSVGATWVFTRNGSTWTQQGTKLVGTGATGANLLRQGSSVAISADGNTAIVGGYGDNGGIGAVWVFTRSGSTWAQQGNKLVGTGSSGFSQQGFSVALSADGNTALIGGNGDNNVGAAWVFTRNGSTWTQQGAKLVGTDATGTSHYGQSVSLSNDGTRALVGGPNDNSNAGAAWVFTQNGSTWTQVGSKLVGTGATGGGRGGANAAQQGYSVALSGDGRTAVLGGPADNNGDGATWIFFNPQALVFSDSPLQVGVTTIKVLHITELRQRIDALRALHPPLGPYPYLDAINSTTILKAQHILELRQALLEVYQQIPQTPPTYSTTPAPGAPIVAADIESLRSAVVAIE